MLTARRTAGFYQPPYRCRDDFLHGNPVRQANRVLKSLAGTTLQYAPRLHRVVLTFDVALSPPTIQQVLPGPS